MKTRLLLLALFSFMATQLSAQKIKWGAELGLNLSTNSADVDPEVDDFLFMSLSYRPGMRIGITAEYGLKDGMALQSGLYYTQKGYYKDLDKMEEKMKEDSSEDISVSGKWGNRYDYIEMPINFVYKFKDFQVFGGPYLAYGIGGKSIIDLEIKNADGETETFDESVDIEAISGDAPDEGYLSKDVWQIVYYKKFDYGFNLGAGYTYDKFLFRVQYSLGIPNILPDYEGNEENIDDEINLKNRAFSFSLSYFFK